MIREEFRNGNIGKFENYYDLFSKYDKHDSGVIDVSEEYAYDGDPQLCEEDKTLYASFYASYDIIIEAENEEETLEKAKIAFSKANFGCYEYMDGCNLDKTIDRIITATDIQWDQNGVFIEDATKIEIPYSSIKGNSFTEIWQNIANYLSKEKGFYHESFVIDTEDENYLKSLFI